MFPLAVFAVLASVVVGAVAGDGPAAGELLSGKRLMLVERALAFDGIVSTAFEEDGDRMLLFAVAIGSDRAIFQEFAFEPDLLAQPDRDEPFNDLEGAVYAAAAHCAAGCPRERPAHDGHVRCL